MNKRIILVALSIVCISSSCITTNSTAYERPKVSYDTTIALFSLEGFRVGMTARMAKQVAEERGYKIKSKFTNSNFDDIAENGTKDSLSRVMFLYRIDSPLDGIELTFEYGKISYISFTSSFHDQQKAEELLVAFLEKHPQLSLSKEEEDFRLYRYQPNEHAWISFSIYNIGESSGLITIAVHDSNYIYHIHNQKFYKEMEAIRRGY